MSRRMMMSVGGDSPLRATWTDGLFDDTNLTTYNFQPVLWGPADPARRLIFCVTAEASGTSAFYISSVQVGAALVAATEHISVISTNNGNSLRTAIYSIAFPEQQSGRVRITLSRAARHCSLSAYSLIGNVRLVGVNSGFINGETLSVGPVSNAVEDSVNIVSSAVGTVLPITYTGGNIARDWLSDSVEYSMSSGSSVDGGLGHVLMTVPPPGSFRLVMCRAAWVRPPPVAGQIQSVTSGLLDSGYIYGFSLLLNPPFGSVTPISAGVNGALVLALTTSSIVLVTNSLVLAGELPANHFTSISVGGVVSLSSTAFHSVTDGNTKWEWSDGTAVSWPLQTVGVTTPVVIT